MNKLLSDFGKKLIYGCGFGMGMGISFIILKKIDPEEKQFNRKLSLSTEDKIQDKKEKLEIQNTQIKSLNEIDEIDEINEINNMYSP